MKFYLIVTMVQIFGAQSLIVPDEIPTILSVIYSNIPVIKKGTDSRIGWGFRLGNRADFQVLTELGPQTYTQPLANQQDKNANNKRNTVDSLANTLYAQRQKDKQDREKGHFSNREKDHFSDTEGGSWLQTWSKSVKQRKPVEQHLPPGAKPGLATGEIDAKSVIPDDDTLKLISMYLERQKEIQEKKKLLTDIKVGDEDLTKLTDLYKGTTPESVSLE